MNCQQVDKYILAYCDNDLPPELANQVEQHIKDCNNCAANMALTKLENSILNNLPPVEPTDSFTANVMQKVFVTTPEHYSSKFLSKKTLIFAIPVAAVLLIFLATSLPSFINLDKNTIPTKISEKDELGEYTPPLMQKDTANIKSSLNDELESNYIDDFDKPKQEEQIDYGKVNTPSNKEIADINNYEEIDEKTKLSDISSRSQILKSASPEMPDYIDLTIYNLPTNYTLANINNISDDEVSYHYLDSSNDTVIDITLTKLTPETTRVKEEAFSTIASLSAEDNNVTPLEENLPFNKYSFEINHEDELYLVTMQSNLPTEKLLTLSSTITITK